MLLAAASFAAPKERDWQEGRLLDNGNNKYFKALPAGSSRDLSGAVKAADSAYDFSMNRSSASTVYDDYVIEGAAAAYLAEVGRFATLQAAPLSRFKFVKFAVEKNKLWFLDDNGKEHEAKILKEVRKDEPALAVKPAAVKETAAAPPVSVQVPAEGKDRPWQSGRLLSSVSNPYFSNVTYTSDTDGSSWSLAQDADGRYAVHGNSAANNSTAYDNYVIESEFCVYLVQRGRPKPAPPAPLQWTKPLKFAVERNKLWFLDDAGQEYEAKVLKMLQRYAIPDPNPRAATR